MLCKKTDHADDDERHADVCSKSFMYMYDFAPEQEGATNEHFFQQRRPNPQRPDTRLRAAIYKLPLWTIELRRS